MLGDLGAAIAGNPGDPRDGRAPPAPVRRPGRPRRTAARHARRDRARRASGRTRAARRPAALDDERVGAYSALMSSSQSLVAGRHPRRVRLRSPPPPARHRRRAGHVRGVRRGARAGARVHRVRPAGRRRARARAAGGRRARASRAPCRAATSSPIRCPRARTSRRSCACCTTTTTARRGRCSPPRGARCRRAARWSSRNRWPSAPGAAPMGAAYFGWYLLAMGQGRPRTAAANRGAHARRRVRRCGAGGRPGCRCRPDWSLDVAGGLTFGSVNNS